MLDETEDSVRLKALVEEMQAMVEATLEFARGVARAEPAAEVDLAVLLADLVNDVGGDRANLAPSSPLPITVRPHALNRALRNLIDNAVRYCRVALKSETARVGRYSLPLNARFCFQRRRFSLVSSRYLINCSEQTGLLSIGAQ